jgi:hypothetical protein
LPALAGTTQSCGKVASSFLVFFDVIDTDTISATGKGASLHARPSNRNAARFHAQKSVVTGSASGTITFAQHTHTGAANNAIVPTDSKLADSQQTSPDTLAMTP